MAIDFVEKFKRYLQEDGKITKTIESYVADIVGFVAYLQNMGVKFQGELKRFYVTSFRNHIIELNEVTREDNQVLNKTIVYTYDDGGNILTKTEYKFKPDPSAQGDHTTFKRNPDTGEITNYETWRPNPKNPTGFDSAKRYDGTGSPHKNPVTGEELMPHVHDKTVPGGVRSPIPWEIPRKP